MQHLFASESCKVHCFSQIFSATLNISQGTVATCLTSGGIFNGSFIANLLQSASEKIFKIREYLINIWPRIWCVLFSDSRCISVFMLLVAPLPQCCCWATVKGTQPRKFYAPYSYQKYFWQICLTLSNCWRIGCWNKQVQMYYRSGTVVCTVGWKLFVKWSHGHHLESMTSYPKSDSINRYIFTLE